MTTAAGDTVAEINGLSDDQMMRIFLKLSIHKNVYMYICIYSLTRVYWNKYMGPWMGHERK